MSFLDRILGRTSPSSAKASAAGPAISAWTIGQAVWTPREYGRAAEEAYVRNAIAFKCVKVIAAAGAAAPWLLHGRRGEEIATHPLLDLLARPAPGIGGADLFEALFAYLLLAGNSYIEAVSPSDRAPPRELWVLRPDRMRVVAGSHGNPSGYEYEVNGRKISWPVDPVSGRSPVMHVKEFHPTNDWYGLPRVDPAAYSIDLHNAAAAHNKALLDNGARPSGALIFRPVTVGGDAVSPPKSILDMAEQRLRDRHQGADNAGRPMVLSGDVQWQSMGMSARDMDFNAGRLDAARDICTAFGVPHILVVPGQSTYNNRAEAKLELYEETVLPLLDKVTDRLNEWLCPRFGDGLKLSVDLDQISALEPRREIKRAAMLSLFDKGLISRDEAREALQYAPMTDDQRADADAARRADVALKLAQAFQIDANAGVFSDEALRTARAEQLAAAGVYPNTSASALKDTPDENSLQLGDDGEPDDPEASGAGPSDPPVEGRGA